MSQTRQTVQSARRPITSSRRIWALALIITVLLSVGGASAQLVSDGDTAIINGTSTNLGAANLTVGTNGPNTTLIVTNGGAITNATGYVGLNVSSTNNGVVITGANSVWNSSGNLFIGNSGSFNTLLITSGGAVTDTSGSIGVLSNANNNQIMVTGTGSLWANSFALDVGSGGSFNTLLITNGGTVADLVCVIGHNPGANNNQVTVTGPDSLLANGANLWVGYFGSFNALLITNGGKVRSAYASLGADSGSVSNWATVSGTGSAWIDASNGGLKIGDFGSFNKLLITDGGAVADRYGIIGSASSASNNQVIVTGPNSMWTNDLYCFVGDSGSFNTLLITSGGMVVAGRGGGAIGVGFNTDANNNQVTVNGFNSLWNIRQGLVVGGRGSFNMLLITNGGTVVTGTDPSNNGDGIGGQSGANSNQVIVTGSGSLWTNGGGLYVGDQGSYNTLIITNGGRLANDSMYSLSQIGWSPTANNNQVTVTGTNSVWDCGELHVGYDGSSSTLLITNSGVVDARYVYLGSGPNSINNLLSVGNGTLTVSNASGSAVLDLRRGSAVFNGGTITADQLLLNTVPPDTFTFNAGTLATRNAAISNGAPFVVGNGSSAAIYHMSGVTASGHSFANGLGIANNSTLTGNGTISGILTVASGGALAPGASIGKIVLSNSPSLSGIIAMDISKNDGTLTNDQIHVAGSATYGGSLTVSNLGPDTLALGNSFQLFSASSYSGAFSSITLPTLSAGLSWTNELLANGTITVVSRTAPSISGLSKTGTNLIFNVTDGAAGGLWKLLTSTNVALPLLSWTTNNSGVFDGSGNVNVTNGINPTEPQRYFRIQSP